MIIYDSESENFILDETQEETSAETSSEIIEESPEDTTAETTVETTEETPVETPEETSLEPSVETSVETEVDSIEVTPSYEYYQSVSATSISYDGISEVGFYESITICIFLLSAILGVCLFNVFKAKL